MALRRQAIGADDKVQLQQICGGHLRVQRGLAADQNRRALGLDGQVSRIDLGIGGGGAGGVGQLGRQSSARRKLQAGVALSTQVPLGGQQGPAVQRGEDIGHGIADIAQKERRHPIGRSVAIFVGRLVAARFLRLQVRIAGGHDQSSGAAGKRVRSSGSGRSIRWA